MSFKFGDTSKERLLTAHVDIQVVMLEALSTSYIDWGISCGHRTYNAQLDAFLRGASSLDPRDPDDLKRAKHMRTPSDAVDIYIWIPGRKDLMYDPYHLCFVAGHIMSVARRFKSEGRIDADLTWGNNWDNDGIIYYDQGLKDMPHFERRVR